MLDTAYYETAADCFLADYRPPYLGERVPPDVRRIVADAESWAHDWARIQAARRRIRDGTCTTLTAQMRAEIEAACDGPYEAHDDDDTGCVNASFPTLTRKDGTVFYEPISAEERAAARARLHASPHHLVANAGGLLQRLVDHAAETARSPQPFLALGAALCAIGAAAGRRYRTETNIRTNLMVLGLAGSGSGKERPRELLAEAFIAAKMPQYLGGSRLASGSGLLSALKHHPIKLLALDEIGHMFAINGSKHAGAHKAEILPLLTELWSKAGGTYLGTDYADRSLNPVTMLHQPHVVVYGVTVPGTLWDALGNGALSDGSLARFLTFASLDEYPAPRRAVSQPVPDELAAGLRRIAGLGGGNLTDVAPQQDAATPADAVLVPFDEAGTAALDRVSDDEWRAKQMHAGTPAVAFWARLTEHTARLALVRAISANPEQPVITAADVQWGEALARHCICTMLRQTEDSVADTPWEANRKAVAAFIRKEGGPVSTSAVQRALRQIDAKDRTRILADLVATGEVIVTKEGSGSPKPVTLYTWIG